jgi:Tfp pilus assembly protein PilN
VRAVNLMPRELAGVQRTGLPKALPLMAAATVPAIAIGLVVAGYRSAHSVVAEKQGELTALQAEVAKATAAAKPVSTKPAVDTSVISQDRTQRLSELTGVLARELPWDTTLRELGRVLPAGVWLTTLSLTSPAPADVSTAPVATAPGAAAPTTFKVDGTAMTQEDVAAFLARLELLPDLDTVTLSSSAQQQGAAGARSLITFTITGAIKLPAAALAAATPPPVAPATTTTPAAA